MRAQCGTLAGYRQHLSHHEPTCQPCRDANYQSYLEHQVKVKHPLYLARKAFLASKVA